MDAWNILVVVVLALILLLILPMVAARNGTKSFTQALMAPLHRKKKRGPLGLEVEPEKKPERHVNNSMQGELTAIVSQLITFTKRQHYTGRRSADHHAGAGGHPGRRGRPELLRFCR